CSFFFKTRSAWSTLLSRTRTCIMPPRLVSKRKRVKAKGPTLAMPRHPERYPELSSAGETACSLGSGATRSRGDGRETIGCELAGAAILDQLIADLLTFAQIIKTGALDSADMNEDVLATVIRLDETVAFLGIEPLDGARAHDEPLSHRVIDTSSTRG